MMKFPNSNMTRVIRVIDAATWLMEVELPSLSLPAADSPAPAALDSPELTRPDLTAVNP